MLENKTAGTRAGSTSGLILILGLALAWCPARAATYTWNVANSGNWSAAGDWTGGIPATDGTASIFFGDVTAANIVSTIDSGWWGSSSTPAPVSGLTFGTTGTTAGSSTKTVTLALGTGVNSFGIGAGGVTSYYANQVTLPSGSGGLFLTADQTWNVANSAGSVSTGAALKGSGVLSKTGAGSLILSGGNGSAWTGSLLLQAGKLQLGGSGSGTSGAFTELGSNAMTMYQGTSIQFNMTAANSTYAIATPITFDASSTGGYTLSAYTSTFTGSTVELQGPLSGTIGGTGVVFNGVGTVTLATFKLSGDNSSLTSSLALANGAGPFLVQTGNLLVAGANALGSGNTLGVALGGTNAGLPLYETGLYATGGTTVRSDVFSDNTFVSGSVLTRDNYIGASGTGTAAFTGNIKLASASSSTNGRASNTHLTAASGGTAVFSGLIADVSEGVSSFSSVIADGGGTVALAGATGNTYAGGTTVSGGTSLVAQNSSGSATGTGSVFAGAAAQSGVTGITQTATTGAPGTNGYYITGISTTGLRVGQTVTSAGAGISGTIVAINPNGTTGTIQISALPTAAGTFNDLSFGALTGTLGGGGILKPTGANSISVASGSLVYPGAGNGGAAATLILDGGSTSAPLLTMGSGAAFTFTLDASSNDEIKFYNYAAGDLALNGNAVHLTLGSGVAPGTYTLFEFYSNSGTTLTASGIGSGLVLDTSGLGGLAASLVYGADSISLAVTPEPSAWLLFLLAGALGIARRAGLRPRRLAVPAR